MKRSTSYLATASAIRSVPSTCTSSRLKFLITVNTLAYWTWKQAILGRVVSPNEIVNNIRMPNAFLYRSGVPEIIFLRSGSVAKHYKDKLYL